MLNDNLALHTVTTGIQVLKSVLYNPVNYCCIRKYFFLFSVPHKNNKFNCLAERRNVELKSGGTYGDHWDVDGAMSVI